jgi:hypothetical protein
MDVMDDLDVAADVATGARGSPLLVSRKHQQKPMTKLPIDDIVAVVRAARAT